MRGGFGALPEALAARRAEGLYRNRGVLESPQGPRVRVDGAELLSFCSNDYLGLANDPRVVVAFREGAARWGLAPPWHAHAQRVPCLPPQDSAASPARAACDTHTRPPPPGAKGA